MAEICLDVDKIEKRFGTLVAVDRISLHLETGECFAFLGPNGAGKSTTIKMLITLIAPTGGDAHIAGFDLRREPRSVRRVIGYVPQLISVDGSLTARENLMLLARLYDLKGAECRARVAEALEILHLEGEADRMVRTFSGGMIRRLEIGQAILHRPRVLFLDEPTSGLDPVGKNGIWQHLQELRQRFGTTIFFSTHNMEEAAAMADRIGIMNGGHLAAIGTVAELTEAAGVAGGSLEDAFLRLAQEPETGDYRAIRTGRRTEGRLG